MTLVIYLFTIESSCKLIQAAVISVIELSVFSIVQSSALFSGVSKNKMLLSESELIATRREFSPGGVPASEQT